MSFGLEVRNEAGEVTFDSTSNIYHVVREIEVPLVRSYTIPLNAGEIVFYFKSARNSGNKPFGPYYRRSPNSLEVFYGPNEFRWPSYCMLVRVIVCSV